MVADVSPSTASVHLNRLKTERLVKVHVQGKHRYYSLEGPYVASALEGLSVLAGGSRDKFVPNTPSRLLAARTCYDHMAGTLGVSLQATMRTISPSLERRRLRLSALTWKQLARCAAASHTHAWIGASGVLMSAARWVRQF